MTMEDAVYLVQQSLWTGLLVAAPTLFAALVVGTAVSLLQTVTQLQEATLVFIPKLASVFLVLVLMGSWMLQTLVAFGRQSFESIAP